MTDDKLRDVRERFFSGELPERRSSNIRKSITAYAEGTARDRLNRIDARLRSVLVRACQKSYPAQKVVERFETYVIRTFSTAPEAKTALDDWDDLLLTPPSVVSTELLQSSRNDAGDQPSKISVQFFFDPESSTGGFHRILLQGVCQYHGLHAVSKSTVGSCATPKARSLEVTGSRFDGDSRCFRLLDAVS